MKSIVLGKIKRTKPKRLTLFTEVVPAGGSSNFLKSDLALVNMYS